MYWSRSLISYCKRFRSTWDIFQTIPRERKSNSETSLLVLKAIKAMMYGFLFWMVLKTAVIAKFSFIVLTSHIGIDKLLIDHEKVGLTNQLYNSARVILWVLATSPPPFVLTNSATRFLLDSKGTSLHEWYRAFKT